MRAACGCELLARWNGWAWLKCAGHAPVLLGQRHGRARCRAEGYGGSGRALGLADGVAAMVDTHGRAALEWMRSKTLELVTALSLGIHSFLPSLSLRVASQGKTRAWPGSWDTGE